MRKAFPDTEVSLMHAMACGAGGPTAAVRACAENYTESLSFILPRRAHQTVSRSWVVEGCRRRCRHGLVLANLSQIICLQGVCGGLFSKRGAAAGWNCTFTRASIGILSALTS